MRVREIPGSLEPGLSRRRGADAAAKQLIGVGQRVQPFLGRDAREIPDPERVGGRVSLRCAETRPPRLVALQVDAERDDGHPLGRDLQQARHDRRVILADGDEAIDVGHLPPNQIERAGAVRFDEIVQEQVLALQRAAHRAVQGLADRIGQSDQQRVRQVDEIG